MYSDINYQKDNNFLFDNEKKSPRFCFICLFKTGQCYKKVTNFWKEIATVKNIIHNNKKSIIRIQT